MSQLIAEGNKFYREGSYQLALDCYVQFANKYPSLASTVDFNVNKTRMIIEKNNENLSGKCIKFEKKNKLNVLLVGRTETYTKGGIYKSCKLIKKHLEQIGHSVVEHDVHHPFNDRLEKFDLCWIYTGDPNRPDFESVDEKVEILKNNSIPTVINLSYNLVKDRSDYIVKKILEYNRGDQTPVLAAFFTESASLDETFSSIFDYTCVLPKTLVYENVIVNSPFKNRKGICIGDASKVSNPSIVGGDAQIWVDALKKKSPDIEIYVYKQYSGKNLIKGVTYAPYMPEKFGNWLSERKLFVCLNKFCTFEMVPCEAQHFGTPVIYRHMPQSLSEYLSITGFSVRTPNELAEIVSWLYNDEEAWNSLSMSSQYNAKSKHIDFLSYVIEGYIRLAKFRANSIMSSKII
ncbi:MULTISPECIES: glycosyltransferase [Desulfovibrio]|uniref:Uncharacterized protein n=1 Tax=Desulfovibrio desulfuricans TaxID=876 RepID=A0AA94HTZ9_DESDE|nr:MULTISPECIES: glycosyltransferase [Desulfovibrio]SFW62066.1 hypothetical protein SAMN02910291_02131 [Desulfovibrio desulfuricans]SPD36502.1 UDP-Glycosyltransferase/glycogen phosphorylase superfamily [Desulfovibrio sp. G11]